MADSRGSFTLEASFVFPFLLSMLLLYVIVALFIYEQGMFYYGAVRSSEAAAFHWDNSKREASGLPPAGEDDGLYWRLASDGLLRGILQLGSPSEAVSSYSFPGAEADSNDLPAIKLEKVGKHLGNSLSGEMLYERSASHGTIITRVYPVAAALLPGGRRAGAGARSRPDDPVEFIRTTDLVRYYAGKFRSSEDVQPDAAGKVLKEYASLR